ncbi:hypothetical protein [Amycolatopsis sp. RTGN1]|uniref:hypothetical protein n=1 Tax=Amycolatopsis ponsaeliensis TaxID=2992142 RepID=UPI00254B7B9C|nr:hypothetical protein [Amycolatopsis sp. RTGN1]
MRPFQRQREQTDVALADVLRLLADAARPLSGPAAVAIARKVQSTLVDVIGSDSRSDAIGLAIRTGQSCETLILGGWAHDDMVRQRPQDCARAVDRFVAEISVVHAQLLASNPRLNEDPYPSATALHTELVCFLRVHSDGRADLIDAVHDVLTWCRACSRGGPRGFAELVTRLISAGEQLVSRWPEPPGPPSLGVYELFDDDVRAFENTAEDVRHSLVTLHPRLQARPAPRRRSAVKQRAL